VETGLGEEQEKWFELKYFVEAYSLKNFEQKNYKFLSFYNISICLAFGYVM